MEFLCYHRDRPGSVAPRDVLGETHWSYMDRFERELIVRGPTLAADGETATGSIHVVDVRDAAAARSFAFEEPLYQAGAFRDVLVRRWRNALGRTMWEAPTLRGEEPGFLVLGFGEGPAVDLEPPADKDALIAHGPLLSDDGSAWLGTALVLRTADPASARALLTLDRYAAVEVHSWEPGGRR